ncbi:uncharacterized protein LOC115628552 [Scaptodrosophila lebanonensis]|uniref:Uncharacterized protein LOC115628552 n=1 Tax=Drosophila lebanonensis TaxID=7225 RepID=A0A6J2TWQ6_DROLE|nr:uncharacterized protein LOC115628552 [Scaptodrosophila lebanonensis]
MASVSVPNADSLYMQLNAAELQAINMKDSPNSNDRDAGFCSASSESEGGDDLALEHSHIGSANVGPAEDYHTTTKMVEVKPLALMRNKRKSTEPSKVVESSASISSIISCTAAAVATGPLKKRIRYTSSADSAVVLTPPAMASPSPSPSRDGLMWDPSQVLPHEGMPHPAHVFVRHPGVTTLHRDLTVQLQQQVQQEPLALVLRKPQSTENGLPHSNSVQHSPKKPAQNKKLRRSTTESPLDLHEEGDSSKGNSSNGLLRPQQRNYKNMTRERRIEANARERTRVHTISAAYETLRRSVPAYASSQKLSKLSVLRVACSYILTLSRMAGEDYSADQSEPTIAECIEAVTSTIQTEGKIKRKKDE